MGFVRRLWRRFGWKTWAAVGLTLAVLATAGVVVRNRMVLDTALMQADPDLIPQDPSLEKSAIAIAKPAYAAHCASCHGDHLQGNPALGAANLSDKDWLYGDGRVAQIEHTILFGIRAGNARSWNLADMPAFGTANPYARYKLQSLTPGDIHDVIEFLMVTGGKKGDVQAAERGGSIFAEKGQCFDCHASDGLGDNSIGAPNLLDNTWLYGHGSRARLFQDISFGLAGSCPAWFQQLSAVTIRALAVYIYSVSHRPAVENAERQQAPPAQKSG